MKRATKSKAPVRANLPEQANGTARDKAAAAVVYEVWLSDDEPECIYKTTSAGEVMDCRSAARKCGIAVDFLVMVNGKPVSVPTVSDAADKAAWERHWARLQTDAFSFYEIATLNEDGSGVVSARHFWIFDAFKDIIERRRDGIGDVIRKRKGHAVAMAGAKAVSA